MGFLSLPPPDNSQGLAKTFDRIFEKLINMGIKIYFITRNPIELDLGMEVQSEEVISYCERPKKKYKTITVMQPNPHLRFVF